MDQGNTDTTNAAAARLLTLAGMERSSAAEAAVLGARPSASAKRPSGGLIVPGRHTEQKRAGDKVLQRQRSNAEHARASAEAHAADPDPAEREPLALIQDSASDPEADDEARIWGPGTAEETPRLGPPPSPDPSPLEEAWERLSESDATNDALLGDAASGHVSQEQLRRVLEEQLEAALVSMGPSATPRPWHGLALDGDGLPPAASPVDGDSASPATEVRLHHAPAPLTDPPASSEPADYETDDDSFDDADDSVDEEWADDEEPEPATQLGDPEDGSADFGDLSALAPSPKPHRPRRKGVRIAAGTAGTAAVVILAAGLLLGTGQTPDSPAAANPDPAAGTAAAPDVRMVAWNGMDLPASATAGPLSITDTTVSMFTQDGLGAAIAAANLSVRLDPAAGPATFGPVLDSQVVGATERLADAVRGQYADQAAAAGVADGAPLPTAPGRLLAYRIDGDPSDGSVLVHLLVDTGAEDRSDFAVPLRWSSGDWAIEAPETGPFFPVSPESGTYTPFAPEAP